MRASALALACVAASAAASGSFFGPTTSVKPLDAALKLRGGAIVRGNPPKTIVKGDAVGSRTEVNAVRLESPKKDAKDTIKVGTYIGLWYLANIVYNILNKKMLNAVPLPWTMATAQLGAGILYILPVWLLRLRAAPRINRDHIKNLTGIATCHTLGHVMTVISLGAGAVSFTHIVKAAEPLFSTLMSALILKSTFPWQVYATLVPIIVGVSMASFSELTFSWISFLNAMGSNTAFSLRAIFSKMAMNKPQGENMTPPNLYAVLTIISFLGLLPITLLVEGKQIASGFRAGIKAYGGDEQKFWLHFATCGLSYYLYNEVAFLALGQVHPITHAVANTIKRVVIMVASVVAFGTKLRGMSIVGSTIAILGTLLYSLAKNRFA